MAEVNNISRSFADNVNYLAELDKQYYKNGFIKRNGIELGNNQFLCNVYINTFDLSLKQHNNVLIHSADVIGNEGLEQFLIDAKNNILISYPDVTMNITVTDGTNFVADKNIDITLGSIDTILGLIRIEIIPYILGSVALYSKYDITSDSNDYIAVLPYLSNIKDDFNNAIFVIGNNEQVLNSLNQNINAIVDVENNLTNINIVASNNANISSVATSIVPNINEILLADDNAAIAAQKALEASNSATNSSNSALSSANSASQSLASAINASASEANALNSYNNTNSKYLLTVESENKARLWASELEDIIVQDGKYSSMHYALKSEDSAILSTNKANEASTSASNALNSANSSATSESNALLYSSNALTYANNASVSEANALASSTLATTKANEASISASNAFTSESNAQTYASNALVSEQNADASLVEFMKIYLGKKSVEPIVDNEGSALDEGAVYYNTVNKQLYVYNGVIWDPAVFNASGVVLSFNGRDGNIILLESDINNVLGIDVVAEINSKQNTLISGSNIKTINNEDILGSGNLSVSTGSGGYAANVYLTTQVSTTNGSYSQLSYTPETNETIISAIVNNNTVLMEDYIFDGDVKAGIIPAGEWGFHLHRRVDNTAADTFIIFEIYKRSSVGIETVLFTASTKSIEDTSFTREDLLITKPAYSVEQTDRVGLKVYASTTRTSDVTVQLKVGDGEASYFNTPLAIRHNQLRARDEVDSHPISSITGLQDELSNRYTKLEVDTIVSNINTIDNAIAMSIALG